MSRRAFERRPLRNAASSGPVTLNPVPALTSLGTASQSLFAGARNVDVNVTSAVPGIIGYVDGVAMATTYVSSTLIRLALTNDVHWPNVDPLVKTRAVTVANPSPGGGLAPGSLTYTLTDPAGLKLGYIGGVNTLITGTGGIATVKDFSANAIDAAQATTTKRPAINATGLNGRYIWQNNGSTFVQTPTFTQAQPFTYFAIMRNPSWTSAKYIVDSPAGNIGALVQGGVTPQLQAFSGSSLFNAGLVINTWGAVTVDFNNASGKLTVDNGTPVTGTIGTSAIANGLIIGAAGSAANGAVCDFAAFMLFNGATPSYISEVKAWTTSVYGVPGASPQTKKIVAIGDSLTYGQGGGWPYTSQMSPIIGVTYGTPINKGVSGNQSSQMLARFTADITSQYDAAMARFIVIIWGGANDVSDLTSGLTVAQAYTSITSMVTNVHALGANARALVITVADQTRTGFTAGELATIESRRQAMNTLIRGRTAGDDGVIDLASTNLNAPGDSLNTTYFADQLHLSNVGYGQVASVAATAVQAL